MRRLLNAKVDVPTAIIFLTLCAIAGVCCPVLP